MVLSVILAVLAAVGNATASVLQRKATRREPESDSLSVSLLWDLVRQPVWWGGISAIVIGFALQAAALATGPILLIQPILVVELGFTLLLSSIVFHTRLHTREWGAVVGMSAGVALLLVGLAPYGGDPLGAPVLSWLLGCGITALVVGALVVLGYRTRHARRAAYLGVAVGIWFGFTAALVAGMTAAFDAGFGEGVRAWQTWALVVVGPAGFVLLQNALRAGRLVASQPGFTLANPLSSVGWGVVVFGEQVRGGLWILAQVSGAAMIAVSTVLLARSPLLQGAQGATETEQAGQQHA
ncbi:DMT family transporter [Amycolatopsis taiwanensis]|uniref:Membrane protein n=1 Tax=Amycolatopsis taiwanensis TaxID=342230 RepID=A0A9W6R5P2_9PSEU|nr:DMT family transporter [Amycolatopsis taiwanensis]GLY68087.1 membrane protein [Amycolatopsis taiwanensis]